MPGSPATTILGETATAEQIANFNQKHGLDRPAFFFSYSSESGLDMERPRQPLLPIIGSGCFTAISARSFRTDRPVLDMILERYPTTIKLAIAVDARRRSASPSRSAFWPARTKTAFVDNLASFIALLGISLPTFVIGPFLVYIFAVKLGWFSPTGSLYPEDIVLPAITLGAALSAILTRMIRSSVIEELGEDYVRTARAKGLSERKVVYKHVLKNGLIPVVTMLGLQLGVLLAGAIITEKIFSWQGLGLLLLEDGIGKARLPPCSGLRSGHQRDLYCREFADGHRLPAARSADKAVVNLL